METLRNTVQSRALAAAAKEKPEWGKIKEITCEKTTGVQCKEVLSY